MHKPLIDFLNEQTENIDIFCFQEVFKSEKNIFHNEIKTNIFSDIKSVLKDFNCYYAPMFEGHDTNQSVDFELYFGQATFVRKNIKVLEEGNIFIYGAYGQEKTKPKKGGFLDFPRNLHYVLIRDSHRRTFIGNLHGFWIPESKEDTPERIEQSDKIINFLDQFRSRKILCGDFNLNPNTKSMAKLEKNMVNLIKKYNIKNTRSNLHKRKDKFADYILVSKNIKVLDFVAMRKDVSDHIPLYLEFG